MISVLLPTRGRPESLAESVESLRLNALHSERVEILCAVDADDAATIEACQVMAREGGQARTWISPERFGYFRLHEYINFLASKATGDWLMLWNDDARMLTHEWDTVIEDATVVSDADPLGLHKVLFMDGLYPCWGERANIFPVWPRAWYQALGYVSRSSNVDVWISEIGKCLGVERRIHVQALHDRKKYDGDDTNLEGRRLMGELNGPDYDNLENRIERARAVRVLDRMYAVA